MILKFAHPERLWLFAALAVLVLWWLRSLWRRRRSWQALAQRGRPPREGAVWWLLAIACLILAVAQPRWGRLGPAPAPGHDVVLRVDVSRSMGAEDAVPSRMGVALEYAEKLVDALGTGPDNRAAVVAFAGRGLLRCPLTENLGAVKAALRRLRPGAVQPGGTDLAAGLDAALEALGTEGHAQGQSIVIFSDGEDLADRWKSRLDLLRDREVTVYAVTVGDADRGHPVPAGADSSERLTYRGKPVESRRSDAALRSIADQTRGVVVALGLASGDPTVLYRNQIEPSARRKELVPRVADMAERFGVFLGGALSCIIGACWPPRRGWSWPVRLGWIWIWRWPRPWPWSRRARLARRLARDAARVTLVLAAGP
ncbi:MAG: vWA domain-containing protein, partial [Isosphaeraceae bacterium]